MNRSIAPVDAGEKRTAAVRSGSMDVIILNDSAEANGGTARVAIEEACQLAGLGHRVTLLAGFGPVDEALTRSDVRVLLTGQTELVKDRIPPRSLASGIRNLRAERLMAELLEGLSAQHTIIHLHGWTKCLSASVIRPALERGFAVVCTLHDYFATCPNGGLFDYQRNAPCPLKPMSWDCIRRNCDKRSYGQKLYRVGRQWAQQRWHGVPGKLRYFVTVSSFSRNLLSGHLPLEATVFDLPNPIAVDRQEPARPGRWDRFLFAGRLSPEKGATLFARAAAEFGAPVTFVGDGSERQAVQELMPSATMTGWLPSSEVREYLSRCRALVCPSVCYETQGIVVQEAAALGVPAIVSDGCAARESIVDGETGLWFKSGDVADLGEKMARLADRSLADRMGRAAYERYWSAPMTPEHHVGALEHIYAEILRRQMAERPAEIASNVSASVAGMSE
jgi:glycosyltransferase involved in cell wall biosynthesis